jgi:hypothetical protein
LGSSTESAKFSTFGLPYAFASHFAPQQLKEALHIYRSNFKASEHLKEPYAIACKMSLRQQLKEEAQLIATSGKDFSGYSNK